MGRRLCKFICAALALVLMLGLTPLSVFAEEQPAPTTGKAGDNITWRVEEGVLYLDGTGSTYDYSDDENYSNLPWFDALNNYRNEHKTEDRSVLRMVIGDGITRLGAGTMTGVSPWNIVDLTFLGDFPEIDPKAMFQMGTVIIARYPAANPTYPESVRTVYGGTEADPMTSWIWVGSNGLIDGQGGENIRWTVQDHVLTLTGSGPMFPRDSGEGGYYSTFRVINQYIQEIHKIVMPEGITDIQHHDFGMLPKLTQIRIPESVSFIGNGAFEGTAIRDLVLPSHLDSIGMFVFNSGAFRTVQELEDNPLNLYFRGDPPAKLNGSICQTYMHDESTDTDHYRVVNIYYPAANKAWNQEAFDAFGSEVNLIANPFTDLDLNEYYVAPILWAVKNGITTGATKTTFEPNAKCTRAQIVTFLWRNAGSPKPQSTKNPFTDLNPREYYMDAVLWAVENGITTGATKTTFEPNAKCTRAQAVTFLWRSQNKPAPASDSHPFTDLNPREYYMDAILWAVENGITNGATKTTFEPNSKCSRAQIVTFLYRCEEN